MHAHDKTKQTEADVARLTVRPPTTTPLQAMLGLPAGAGNTAIVQRLRATGHPHAVQRVETTEAAEAAETAEAAPEAEDLQYLLTQQHWDGLAAAKMAENAAQPSASKAGKGKAAKPLKAALLDASKGKKGGKGGKAGMSTTGTPRQISDIIERVGPALLDQLKDKQGGQLFLYRAMSLEEAQSLLTYWGSPDRAAVEEYLTAREPASQFKRRNKGLTVGKHLGDLGQADQYYNSQSAGYAVMLKFALKPGAHEYLFTPEYMALQGGKKAEAIRQAQGGEFQNGTNNEGVLQGYIGVKAESNEPFSLSIAQGAPPNKRGEREVGASQLLFQLFVDTITVEKNRSGTLLPTEV
ncbi:hypothetical protein SUDANB145_03050 [Streptomyces sp. enrichment culture]|uniref:hypothetical protein n=1 Tax=Streptomyces sp. enrichment culture TaxID=1795815 RepID=UPI003F55724D